MARTCTSVATPEAFSGELPDTSRNDGQEVISRCAISLLRPLRCVRDRLDRGSRCGRRPSRVHSPRAGTLMSFGR